MAKRRTSTSEKSQPTMHDVARVAGVSQMTVSRVMRGTGYISKDVRKQVVVAAREIGYVHNRLAGGNATYDNPIVGVVVPTMQNRVFTEVLSGINATLDESGLRPVFGVSEYDPGVEEDLVFDLLSWRPRGLILPGLEHTDSLRRIVAQTGVRVAEIMDTDGDPISACFGFSHVRAGEDMAKHLIERGYRTFAYVGSQGGLDLRATKRSTPHVETDAAPPSLPQVTSAFIIYRPTEHTSRTWLTGRSVNYMHVQNVFSICHCICNLNV